VRNIRHDPYVRVRLRIGLRYLWMPGIATVLPDDDPLARQRRIIAWHPLRALNAINVRVLGADLLTVHVQLMLDGSSDPPLPGTRNDDRRPDPYARRRPGHRIQSAALVSGGRTFCGSRRNA
jgi:hypothetical protein